MKHRLGSQLVFWVQLPRFDPWQGPCKPRILRYSQRTTTPSRGSHAHQISGRQVQAPGPAAGFTAVTLLDARQKEWLRVELRNLTAGIKGEREAAFHLDGHYKDGQNNVVQYFFAQ
jgi:hypothetical protein